VGGADVLLHVAGPSIQETREEHVCGGDGFSGVDGPQWRVLRRPRSGKPWRSDQSRSTGFAGSLAEHGWPAWFCWSSSITGQRPGRPRRGGYFQTWWNCIGLGAIAAGWLIYDVAVRSSSFRNSPTVFCDFRFGDDSGGGVGTDARVQRFARAYIHVGAILGTVMTPMCGSAFFPRNGK